MQQPPETWRSIPRFEGIYEVSDLGRVRSLDRTKIARDGQRRRYRGRVLDPRSGIRYAVILSDGERQEWRRVHRLVLEAFVGPCPDGMEACHGPGGPYDNRLSNLRWDTKSANARDRRRDGTDFWANKERCPQGHLLEGANLEPGRRADVRRKCRSCSNARAYCRYHPEADLEAEMQRYYRRHMPHAAD